MSPSRRTRRDLLAGLALSLTGALAGCDGILADDGTPTPVSYDHLEERRVFVADSLERTVPKGIETAQSPDTADVIVLPATTDRPAATAVGWIEAGARIALVGAQAQATWLDWQDSDAYHQAYPDHRGRAVSCASESSGGGATPTECEPPELLVGWEPREGPPTTYRRTWGGTDDPTDAQVFAGIDASYEEW